MTVIKKITSRETFPVRNPVLRPGKPVDSCVFDGDDLATTVHFGIYEKDALIGIVSVFEASAPQFPDEKQYQMRGMAVLEEHQKKGLGEKLVQEAEDYIRGEKGEVVWFNAREIAVGFYKKMGYSIVGQAFDIPGVGIHYVMYKRL